MPLQASSPYPRFGTINLYEAGDANGTTPAGEAERRFSHGLTYLFSYAFARDIALRLGNDGAAHAVCAGAL
jgi:hypothetical protein